MFDVHKTPFINMQVSVQKEMNNVLIRVVSLAYSMNNTCAYMYMVHVLTYD